MIRDQFLLDISRELIVDNFAGAAAELRHRTRARPARRHRHQPRPRGRGDARDQPSADGAPLRVGVGR